MELCPAGTPCGDATYTLTHMTLCDGSDAQKEAKCGAKTNTASSYLTVECISGMSPLEGRTGVQPKDKRTLRLMDVGTYCVTA